MRGFCSEECIEFFYSPLLKYYEQLLHSFRTKFDLQDEIVIFPYSDKELVEEVIRAPSEIWRSQNDLSEEMFTYIRHFNQGSALILCTVLNKEPSFIFLVTKTGSEKLISEFRIGERLMAAGDEDTDEIITHLENKKSQILADLLGKRLESDIPFEKFTIYDSCLDDTINAPDEVFEFKDREGDILQSAIKSFTKFNENFFYIVITFNKLPILSFPTTDVNLYAEFRIGKQISSNFKN
jgi:hypothetical protein